MIDTHTHLSKKDYEDVDQVIDRAVSAGVSTLVISGYDTESIKESLDIASKHNNIYVTVGYHPDEAEVATDEDLKWLKDTVLNSEKIVGIGEIGLDYYYGKDSKEKQIILFEKQLELAEELNLPVVIHSRDAVLDTMNCIKKYKVRGVMHCFSGSLETAKEYINLGFYLGIGGVLTFKNCNLSEVLKKISMDNIVLETDAPYLAPVPYRGKKNESAYIIETAKFLANIKNLSVEEVDEITTKNAIKLFDLK